MNWTKRTYGKINSKKVHWPTKILLLYLRLSWFMIWFALILARDLKMSSNVVTGGWADGCVGENSETICLHHRVALVTATLQTQRGNGHKWNVDASSFQNVRKKCPQRAQHRSQTMASRLLQLNFRDCKIQARKAVSEFWSKILYVAVPRGEILMIRQSSVTNSTQCVINKLADAAEYQLPFKLRREQVHLFF